MSSRGNARAEAYVNYFKNFSIDGKPLKIDYLFAASDSSNSRRPRLTLEPIAQALGISVDSQFKSKDFLKLAHKIESLPQSSNVLICWHQLLISRGCQLQSSAYNKAKRQLVYFLHIPADLDLRKLEPDIRAALPKGNNARIDFSVV